MYVNWLIGYLRIKKTYIYDMTVKNVSHLYIQLKILVCTKTVTLQTINLMYYTVLTFV